MTAGVYGTAVAWSAEHVDTLRQLWLEGHSARVIGDRLGRTRNSVIGRVHRLNLAKRVTTVNAPRKKPTPKAYNPGAFRKSRAKPAEMRVVPVKPPRPQEVPPPEARMISLMDLTPFTCKWPIGHPGEPGFAFCGAVPFPNRVYCEHHARLAYMPPKARAERPAEKVAA